MAWCQCISENLIDTFIPYAELSTVSITLPPGQIDSRDCRHNLSPFGVSLYVKYFCGFQGIVDLTKYNRCYIEFIGKVSVVQKLVLSCISIMLVGCDISPANSGGEIAYSEIKADEYVAFFRTAAWQDEAKNEWHVPIHGWIYENEHSAARKALFATILKDEFELETDAQTETNFTRRFNLLIADNERGKRIVVDVAGQHYVMPPSHENGHFETTLIIPNAEVDKYAEGTLVRYSAVTQENEAREFSGETLLVKPAGLSIISDIDDTVKITNVTDRERLLENTFFLDFKAAPGMAQLYNQWSEHDVSLHFVSSSPWQLYPVLEEFLDKSDFPRSSFSLKPVRFRDETLLDLFKKGTETKPVAIRKLLQTYLDRKFVLVGDSGEQDPEVYATLMRQYPDQILKVYIRNVTEESADNERFESLFRNIQEDRWQLFDDPLTLTLPE